MTITTAPHDGYYTKRRPTALALPEAPSSLLHPTRPSAPAVPLCPSFAEFYNSDSLIVLHRRPVGAPRQQEPTMVKCQRKPSSNRISRSGDRWTDRRDVENRQEAGLFGGVKGGEARQKPKHTHPLPALQFDFPHFYKGSAPSAHPLGAKVSSEDAPKLVAKEPERDHKKFFAADLSFSVIMVWSFWKKIPTTIFPALFGDRLPFSFSP